jgi:hypothetical protein
MRDRDSFEIFRMTERLARQVPGIHYRRGHADLGLHPRTMSRIRPH